MTRSKRSFLQLAGWGSLAALAALAGCSKKEETVVATTTPAASSAAPSATASAAAPAAAPSGTPLKIAFAYVGPVGDGGWTFAHNRGRLALEKEFGS